MAAAECKASIDRDACREVLELLKWHCQGKLEYYEFGRGGQTTTVDFMRHFVGAEGDFQPGNRLYLFALTAPKFPSGQAEG